MQPHIVSREKGQPESFLKISKSPEYVSLINKTNARSLNSFQFHKFYPKSFFDFRTKRVY